MTDQFYYNCLVPNATVVDDRGGVNEDVPPPRPPRPQRPFDGSGNVPLSSEWQDDLDTRSSHSQVPEIPPKLFGTNVPPIHKRQRSEPLAETQSWAPQPQYYEDPFSDSEKSPPVVEPPWILDSASSNNTFIENYWGQGHSGSDESPGWQPPAFDFNTSRESRGSNNSSSSLTSPIWQDSERIQGYVLRGSDRTALHTKRNSVSEIERSHHYSRRNHSSNELDRMPSYSKRNSVSEIERTSKGFMSDKSPVHDLGNNSTTGYNQSPVLPKRSPGMDRVSHTGSMDSVAGSSGHIPHQMSPRTGQIPGSAEQSPGSSQPSPRQQSMDSSVSYEYPQTSTRSHEYHQSQVPRQSSTESENVSGVTDRNNGGVSNLRPSYSFKDNTTRAQSAYVGASTQPIPATSIQPEIQPLQSASAQLQRRSLPTPSRAIVEENIEADNVSRLDLGQSNITDAISHSIESLDEVDSVHEVRYDDVELGSLDTEEPETWSETVDKKLLKKLNAKDIKRQDTIWELIQTERQYCKRLKTLQIFFRDGFRNELRMPVEYVDRMFPQLDDLISIHMSFLRQLQDLQNKRPDRLVEEIGPTLKEQFSGDTSNKMKSAYGAFCSGHLEAVQLYKDLLAKEKRFQNFIKQKSTHHLCRRREVPDFILLITQRPTKYPTLIEAVIKSTKDKKDRECLLKALDLSKNILHNVDQQVAAAERAMKLKDICHRLDSRSFAVHRGKKFKKSDIQGRILLHEGIIGWKNARGKSIEVLAVVLQDVLLFLQENNQKYTFFSQDNKESVISLFNLLVREKRDTRDTIGIYLISQNKKSPEMYEVVFSTTTEMQKWAKILRSAVEQCPEEVEEEVQTAVDEERLRQERRAERAQKIQEQLHERDMMIRECCEAKNKLLAELHAIYSESDEQSHSRPSSRDFEEVNSPAENAVVLQAAIQEVSMAASQLTNMLQGNGTNLSRSVSSVGEHSSNTYNPVPVPKRAETFAGFDNHDLNRVKLKGTDTPDTSDGSVNRDPDGSDLDTSQYSDISTGTGVHQNYDSEGESGRGSIQSSTSSMTVVQMSKLTQDQSNIAHLVATLNNIVHLTASQGTAVETLRAQLAEANERINKLSADVHGNKPKSGYRHNQLEELRNLQGVIQKEKEDWEMKKTKENRVMEQDRAQLDEMKKNLDKQENDLKQQKEEFNKKREVLQRQMDLLRQSGQLPKDTSLSDLETSVQSTEGTEDKPDFVPGHRRSASAGSTGESKKNVPSSSKEGNFRSDGKSMSKLQSFSFGSSKQSLPVHLLSATNEQKIGSKNVQQLPSKLLGNLSGSPQAATQSGLKNSSGNLSQNAGNNQSSPSLTHEHGSGDSQLGHSASTGQIPAGGNQGNNQHGTSVTVPAGNRHSNRPKPSSMVASLSGVLKLSEKGDKKSKNSSQSGDKGARSSPPQNEASQQRPKSGQAANRNPNINHKPQKSDSDVIYF